MDATQIFSLGLGLTPPWIVSHQELDTNSSPFKLKLALEIEKGSLVKCPCCGELCKPHDFIEKSWRHLNFFQHHCIIIAKVPRVGCQKCGVHLIDVPWARQGSGFTLLFEQVVLSLAREMPVLAIAREVDTTDKKLWRIIKYYIDNAVAQMDLSGVTAIGIDETARCRGHNYITIVVDMNRDKRPVVFCTPNRNMNVVNSFADFLRKHNANPEDVTEVTCDMSPAFISGIEKYLPNSQITIDWFHIIKHLTDAVDKVRKIEARTIKMPKSARWSVLKGSEHPKTEAQKKSLQELAEMGTCTAIAYAIKEKARWIRQADNSTDAHWRITEFFKMAESMLDRTEPIYTPMFKALETFRNHVDRIVRHWSSTLSNARLEGFNGLFQAARYRARGYRNAATFMLMVYLIGSPILELIKAV